MITWKQQLPGYEWLIHQIWYLQVDVGEQIEPKPYLVPNPRSHLLFTPKNQSYAYINPSFELCGQGSHLLTKLDAVVLLNDCSPITRFGITFRPEGLYCLHQQAVTLFNQAQWFDWLDDYFGPAFQQVVRGTSQGKALLADQKSCIDTLILAFDQMKLTRPASQDRAWHLAHKVLNIIDSQLGIELDINELALLCGYSRRTLERLFKQVVGLSLKQYWQMHRLELMILALQQDHSGKSVDWADFSARFGFSDQSHLIRTLKMQLQQTPAGYLDTRNLTIDVYGDFES